MVGRGPWRVPNISNRMFSEGDPRHAMMGQFGREIYLYLIIFFFIFYFIIAEEESERVGMECR